jgi:hypothetical protein
LVRESFFSCFCVLLLLQHSRTSACAASPRLNLHIVFILVWRISISEAMKAVGHLHCHCRCNHHKLSQCYRCLSHSPCR